MSAYHEPGPNFMLEVKPMSLEASFALAANQLDRIIGALELQTRTLGTLVTLTNEIRLALRENAHKP